MIESGSIAPKCNCGCSMCRGSYVGEIVANKKPEEVIKVNTKPIQKEKEESDPNFATTE